MCAQVVGFSTAPKTNMSKSLHLRCWWYNRKREKVANAISLRSRMKIAQWKHNFHLWASKVSSCFLSSSYIIPLTWNSRRGKKQLITKTWSATAFLLLASNHFGLLNNYKLFPFLSGSSIRCSFTSTNIACNRKYIISKFWFHLLAPILWFLLHLQFPAFHLHCDDRHQIFPQDISHPFHSSGRISPLVFLREGRWTSRRPIQHYI